MKLLMNLLGIGDKTPDPEKMSISATKLLIFLITLMTVVVLISNLAAMKIWSLDIYWPTEFFPFKKWKVVASLPVDAGIFLFPVSYVAGDLLVNIYGKKMANFVAVFVSLLAAMTVGYFWFIDIVLPNFRGVDNSAFDTMSATMRMTFLASVAGFLAGQLVNNDQFAAIRSAQQTYEYDQRQERKAFRKRALWSSVPAHLVDSVLFETLAFWGRVSTRDFVTQITFAFGAAFFLEALLSWKFTPWLAAVIKYELHYDDGKRII